MNTNIVDHANVYPNLSTNKPNTDEPAANPTAKNICTTPNI